MTDSCFYCISSAVVIVLSNRIAEIRAAIAQMANTEISAVENGRLVIVMEGATADDLASRLIAISNIEGVVAANMVFEHIEEEQCPIN
jgi:nitrate reductase NapD